MINVCAVAILVLVASASAQERPGGKITGEITSTAPANTNFLAAPKSVEKAQKPLVAYSGLGPEIARSTNRWRMFSLRRPLAPKEDGANVIRDVRGEAAKPVKILSIDF